MLHFPLRSFCFVCIELDECSCFRKDFVSCDRISPRISVYFRNIIWESSAGKHLVQLKKRECQIRQITRHESQPLFVWVFLLPLGNHINIRTTAYTSTTDKKWWTGLGPQRNVLVPALPYQDSDLSSSELLRVGTSTEEDHPLLSNLR